VEYLLLWYHLVVLRVIASDLEVDALLGEIGDHQIGVSEGCVLLVVVEKYLADVERQAEELGVVSN
jgi:hypothetical protein